MNIDEKAVIDINLEKNGFEKHYRLTLDKDDILQFQDLLEHHSIVPFSLEQQLKQDYPLKQIKCSKTRKIKNRTPTPYNKKKRNHSLKYKFPSLKKTKDFKF